MKKVLFTLLVVALCLSCLYLINTVTAADWSQYESGRDNIRLDGYQDQPGYIAFTDGGGNTVGYLFMSEQDGKLHVIPRMTGGAVSTGAHDLTTTKITNTHGYRLSTE